MLTSKVAKRYAQGLLDYAQEANATDGIFSEMKDIVKIMTNSNDLVKFFQTPFIDAKKKSAVASEVFRDFSPVSKNLIQLVIRQGRESNLKDIAEQFISKVEDLRGVQRITLTTATQLDNRTVEDILRSTELVNHSNAYDLKTSVDPSILGGYVLRVGDQQIDASVRTKLNNVKKEFQLN